MADEGEESVTGFKTFIRKAFKPLKKIGTIIIVIFLILAMIIAAYFDFKVKEATNSNDVSSSNYRQYGPQAYFDSIYISEENGLIAEQSIDEMWEKDSRYSKYLSNVDALAYFLNAQLVTQYPFVDGLPIDQINGTVKFYRNNSSAPMTYVSKDEFKEYVDGYNNGDSNAIKQALSSFTMEESGKITIAYLIEDYYCAETNCEEAGEEAEEKGRGGLMDTAEGTKKSEELKTELRTTSLSYTNYIKNYILPFNLLWSIVVIGSNAQAPRKCRTVCTSYCFYGL